MSEQEAVFDQEQAIARLGDDRELYAKVLKAFVDDVVLQIKRLERAFAAEDMETVASCAHILQSASATVGANDLASSAAQLSKCLDDGGSGDLKKVYLRTKQSYNELVPHLEKEKRS